MTHGVNVAYSVHKLYFTRKDTDAIRNKTTKMIVLFRKLSRCLR